MGNCQAIDAATLIIQHPNGKADKLYWPVSANEVMKMNPGHYVALLLSTTLYPTNNNGESCNSNTTTTTTNPSGSVRLTRIKLLRPNDTLVLGHVYRLITSQEVMKGLVAKKQAKMKKSQSEPAENKGRVKEKHGRRSGLEKDHQGTKSERHRSRTTTATSTNSAAAAPRSKTWQPSLQSISEAVGNGSLKN